MLRHLEGPDRPAAAGEQSAANYHGASALFVLFSANGARRFVGTRKRKRGRGSRERFRKPKSVVPEAIGRRAPVAVRDSRVARFEEVGAPAHDAVLALLWPSGI